MKRTIMREIFIEIETVRVTRKRRVRKTAPTSTETEVSNQHNPSAKTSAQLPPFFDKIF